MNKNFKISFMTLLTLSLLVLTPCHAENNITLNIKNGEVQDVLSALACGSGKNIVTDSSVHGRISLNIADVHFTDALNLVTSASGLAYNITNNTIIVSNADNINKNTNNITVIKLNYLNCTNLESTVKDLFPSCKTSIEPITNSIIFTGSFNEAHKLQQLIKNIDQPNKQVTLEAKIIALNKEDSENLGINWNWDNIPQRDSQNSHNNENTADDSYPGSIKLGHNYTFNFSATLNALFSSGKAKILASPRIITLPGQEASIFIGDHIPVQTEKHDSSGFYTSTEYLDAGIKLTYNPIISADGKMITAQVHTEVSTPSLISELKNYKITSRTATTNVSMLSGETLIIGGLINEEEQKTIQKIPFLSNIPLLGELFKNKSFRKNKTEVVMILTPYITDAGKSPAIYSNPDDLSGNTLSE